MGFEENSSDIVSPEYQKGFNEGYILATYEPEITQVVSLAEGMGERLSGIKDGIEEANLEKEKDKWPTLPWMNKSKSINEGPAKDINKDKGDLEKE